MKIGSYRKKRVFRVISVILSIVGVIACLFWYFAGKTLSLLIITSVVAFGISFVLFVISLILKRNSFWSSKQPRDSVEYDLIGRIKEFWCITFDLLSKCIKWIITNYIIFIVTIALVLVFSYFENDILETFPYFINSVVESKIGEITIWGLGFFLLVTIIYNVIKTIIKRTLPDGHSYYLSLIVCSFITYSAIAYPQVTDNLKTDNPIVGHEWTLVILFILFGLYSLVLPIVLFFCD